jgi:hypothetical protein
MANARRFLVITAGLIATGAVVGALAAMAGYFIGALKTDDGPMGVWGYSFLATVGAAYGAVLAPLFGWLVLRYVPLGRAIGWTALGTVIGGAVGVATHSDPLFAAPAGFVMASILARLSVRRRAAKPETV